MPVIAPWLRPADPLEAIRTGANIGLTLRQQDLAERARFRAENEAANRLRFAYDQLGQQVEGQREARRIAEEQNAAQQLMAQARMAAQLRSQDALENYRQQQLQNAERGLGLQEQRLNAPTAAIQNANQASAWLQDANKAYAAGDSAAGDMLKQKAETLTPKGFSFETYSDEAGHQQFRISHGAAGAGLKGAAGTMAQKQMLGMQNSMQILGELRSGLRSSDVGISGVVGEALDRYLPQFGMGSPDLIRADNRTKLKAAIQGMVRLISSDDRFSNEDRQKAELVAPSAGFGENIEHAQQTIKTLQDIFRNRTRINAEALGAPIPNWAMTLDEIARGVAGNKITREAALDLIRRYNIID